MTHLRDRTLYVIRHGQCEHNLAGRAASWDDSPLTAAGREQARANGALLKELEPELSRFAFYASPIHRTCNTMELVREASGLPATGYRADHQLMEIHFGDHTWMTREEIAAHTPNAPNGLDGDWEYVRPNGESWAHLHARVGRFLETLSHDAVIVTHFGPARMIQAHYLGMTPGQALEIKPAHAGVLRLAAGAGSVFGN